MKADVKVGIKALRLVAFVAFLWLFLEGMRVWYFAPDRIEAFMSLGRFFLGPWFAVFAAGAGGSHAKRLSEGALQTARAKSANGLTNTSNGGAGL